MEKIDEFYIDLDLSGCKVIYDYVAKEELHVPASGVWDYSVFRGRGQVDLIPEGDENDMVRINLLDDCLMDTRYLEKKVKEKSSKQKDEFDEVFGDLNKDQCNLPLRLLPIFHQGDKVKGKVILKLNDALNMECLTLKCVGETVVNIRIYHKHGYYDDTRYEKYMEEKKVLWEKVDDKVGQGERRSLLTDGSAPAQSQVLTPGRHVFDFEFVIPSDAPQSVPPLVISCFNNYAHLRWRVKARLEKGSAFRKGNVATHRGIWVETPLDIALNKDNLQSVLVEESLGTGAVQFWKTGKIVCRASIPRMGHLKGESVKLKLEVDNLSKGEIVKVQARISLHGKARLSTSKISLYNKINFKSTKVSAGPIGAGICPTFTWELPWDFSESSADGRMLPVGKLEESSLLEITYDVVVKIKRKGLHRDMEFSIPINVGNIDSSMK